ncbi:hypothetical protein D3C72_2157570 [compost metagenome]
MAAPAGLFRPETAGVGLETSLAESTLRRVPSVPSRNRTSPPLSTMPPASRLTPRIAPWAVPPAGVPRSEPA